MSGPVRPVTLDDGAHAQRPGPRHGGDEQPEAAKAAAHLAEWLPVCARALDPAALAAVEPHARSAAAAAQPRTVSDVHRMLRVAFDHTLWTLDELGFLDPATVWHPENGRIWVDEVNADRSVDWRQEAGRTLAQIGRAVNPRSWPAGTEPLTKTGPAAVYDEPGEAALKHAAILKGAPGRADELAVTGFSAGGGLNGPQIALAMPSDVIHLGGERVGIWVRGRHARLVPIRADYTALVLRAVELAGDERFITGHEPQRGLHRGGACHGAWIRAFGAGSCALHVAEGASGGRDAVGGAACHRRSFVAQHAQRSARPGF